MQGDPVKNGGFELVARKQRSRTHLRQGEMRENVRKSQGEGDQHKGRPDSWEGNDINTIPIEVKLKKSTDVVGGFPRFV